MTPSTIIKRLGGASALAKALGLPANDVGAKRVRAWAARQSIPGEYWASIAAISKEIGRGVTLEVLAAAHAAPPTAVAASQPGADGKTRVIADKEIGDAISALSALQTKVASPAVVS